MKTPRFRPKERCNRPALRPAPRPKAANPDRFLPAKHLKAPVWPRASPPRQPCGSESHPGSSGDACRWPGLACVGHERPRLTTFVHVSLHPVDANEFVRISLASSDSRPQRLPVEGPPEQGNTRSEGARGGVRTRTLLSELRGLSPLRLPIPPPGLGGFDRSR